jgi:hypothetical protein
MSTDKQKTGEFGEKLVRLHRGYYKLILLSNTGVIQ